MDISDLLWGSVFGLDIGISLYFLASYTLDAQTWHDARLSMDKLYQAKPPVGVSQDNEYVLVILNLILSRSQSVCRVHSIIFDLPM